MQASSILMQEHRQIEGVLASLEAGARRLEKGESIPPKFFVEAADFIKGFADGCHHAKEEGVLFPAMEAAGVRKEGGPIGAMLAQHEEGRRLTAAMRAAAETLEAGVPAAKAEVVRNALAYVALLRMHISREDDHLFPMVDRLFPETKQEQLVEAFERVEQEKAGEGEHENYLHLAKKLEKEAEA
ncbi:MAG: hemerythrin domain-containing protein [Anaerolineales bacterium]|jgi:hemerythrin-like domain-containing protein